MLENRVLPLYNVFPLENLYTTFLSFRILSNAVKSYKGITKLNENQFNSFLFSRNKNLCFESEFIS